VAMCGVKVLRGEYEVVKGTLFLVVAERGGDFVVAERGRECS
jgi:hypothetical protein